MEYRSRGQQNHGFFIPTVYVLVYYFSPFSLLYCTKETYCTNIVLHMTFSSLSINQSLETLFLGVTPPRTFSTDHTERAPNATLAGLIIYS
jgi:hypothetical protein